METIIKKRPIFDKDGEHIDTEYVHVQTPPVQFTPINDPDLVAALLDFAMHKNIGKVITVQGTDYELDYISESHRPIGRGLSIYYRVGRSILRISDHWSRTQGYERSRKLNCGGIDTAWWELVGPAREYSFNRYSGTYPWRMLAGKAGLGKLNKSVDHWKK